MSGPFLLFAAGVYLLAGTIKGTIGLGLPTTAVSVLAQLTDPRSAIALALIPMIVTNGWQVWRAGDVAGTLSRYRWFLATELLLIGAFSQVAGVLSPEVVGGVLGVAIVLFALASLWRQPPRLPDHLDRRAQLGFGAGAGVLGGIAGIFAPPVVVYLQARRLDPDEFVRATGCLLGFGSLILLAGYWRQGFVTPPVAGISTVLLVPALLGYTLGEHLRQRLGGERFRQAVLVFFLLSGLNLLRRAFA